MARRRSTAVLALVHCMLLSAALHAEPRSDASPRPNVLLIMCDQLNAKALSCYGGPVATPNIDRLAQSGVRFTQAVCPTPFCSPTRASIVTGMYPHAHGIVVNCGNTARSGGQQGITNQDVTTEKILNGAGFSAFTTPRSSCSTTSSAAS